MTSDDIPYPNTEIPPSVARPSMRLNPQNARARGVLIEDCDSRPPAIRPISGRNFICAPAPGVVVRDNPA